MQGFDLFDHTADMGVRVRADTREGLIEPAAAGLYFTIGELVPFGQQLRDFQFKQEGSDDAVLLRDFLTELLILFERDHAMLSTITSVQFPEGKLEVTGQSSAVDSAKSVYHREVKAITYHDLELRDVGAGYEATFIVDI